MRASFSVIQKYIQFLYQGDQPVASTFIRDLPGAENKIQMNGVGFFDYMTTLTNIQISSILEKINDTELTALYSSWKTKTLEEKNTLIKNLFSDPTNPRSLLNQLKQHCLDDWISKNLSIPENNSCMTELIQCTNQCLSFAADFCSKKITPQFSVALADLGAHIEATIDCVNFHMQLNRIFLEIHTTMDIISSKSNQSMRLCKPSYQYALVSATETVSAEFRLITFTLGNDAYETLCDDTKEEKDRHAAAFLILHQLVTQGTWIENDAQEMSESEIKKTVVNGYVALIQSAKTLTVTADLSNISAEELSMQKSNFKEVILCCAKFGKADLRGADFSDADLRGADLRNANVSGAIFTGIIIDKHTKFLGIIDEIQLNNSSLTRRSNQSLNFENQSSVVTPAKSAGRAMQTTCDNFWFADSADENAKKIGFTSASFIPLFLKGYTREKWTPRLMQIVTELNKSLSDDTISVGSKVLRILAHAEKTGTFLTKNVTLNTLEKIFDAALRVESHRLLQ